MNVLMISQDKSIFANSKSGGNTLARMQYYFAALKKLQPGSTLTCLVYTPARHEPFSPETGLAFIPVQAGRVQFFPWAGYRLVKKMGISPQPDLITAQNPAEAGLLGVWLSRRFGIPLEIQYHFNIFSPYWLAKRPLWHRVKKMMAKWVTRRASGIRVVASKIKQQMTDFWGLPAEILSVIPVPVFYAESTPGFSQRNPADAKKLVLFVGRFCYQKNLPGLFEIIAAIAEQNQNKVTFLLAGDGPQRPYVDAQIERLKNLDIQAPGVIPYEQMPGIYAKASVLILPSFYEGLPRVVVESYLHGVPVVASPYCGLEDVVLDGKNGFLADIAVPQKFAQQVTTILNDRTLAQEMGLFGELHVKKTLAPERLTAQMVETWHEMVKK